MKIKWENKMIKNKKIKSKIKWKNDIEKIKLKIKWENKMI